MTSMRMVSVRRIRNTVPRYAMAVLAVVLGCKGAGGLQSADSAKSAGDAMAGMPGMDTAKEKDDVPSGSSVSLTAAQIRHGAIAWQPVTIGTASGTVTVPGQLVPNEDRTARLGASAGGRVVSVAVRPGDRVSKGQTLVSLQSPEAGTAQSDVAKARAELAARQAQAIYAKSARDRADRLLALKVISRQDYERAVADDELARGAVAQAEAEVTRARTSADQLGASASANGELVLRSPLAGVVLARTAVPGSVVEAGAPLVIVTDPTNLWLNVNAPETMAGAFRIGTAVRFSVPAYGAEIFAARVDAVGAGLDPDTRTLSVRAPVDNRTGRLKPEMIATVAIDGGAPVRAAMVPDEAIQMVKGRPVVFIVRQQPNGSASFALRDVDVGSRIGGRTAVTRGLSGGDVVVIKGAFAIKAELEKATTPKMEM